ncbi:MAG: CheY-like chemotaxis protein [Spirosomataceae bacterium]|jgi:CheY-like chemotaxis protein
MESSEYIILVADDDEDDIQFFQEALEELEQKTVLVTVNNGVALMKYLTDSCNVPHALFLDMNMPLKNGSDCLKELRAMNHCQELLIIIYSTAVNQEHIPSLIAQGSSHYIRKPNEFQKIKTAIQTVLSILSGTLVYQEFIIDLDKL